MAEDLDLRYEQIEYRQRLKAAVYYTSMKICEQKGEEKDASFSRQVTAVIGETVWKQCQHFAQDLELFAKHGKRTTITSDDVKLLVRKSSKLHKYMSQLHDAQVEEKQVTKKPKKSKKKSVAAEASSNIMETDEDSNIV